MNHKEKIKYIMLHCTIFEIGSYTYLPTESDTISADTYQFLLHNLIENRCANYDHLNSHLLRNDIEQKCQYLKIFNKFIWMRHYNGYDYSSRV